MEPIQGGEDPYTLRARLDGSAIATYSLMMLIVPLRLLCRKANKNGFWWDDWLSIVSLLWANGLFFVIMIYIRPDIGFHITEVPMEHIPIFLKAFLAAQLFYVVAIGTIKLAILAFYWRLFSVAGRVPLLTMIGIVSSWILILVFLVIFQCKPIDAQWNPLIQDKVCMGAKAIYAGGSVPNIVTDLVLIIMPLPYIWKLHVRVAQRIILAGVFMVGCFVLIVSIIRFRVMMSQDINDPDITYNMYEVVVWSVVEVNIGLVCACLPSLRPVFTLLRLDRWFGSARSKVTGQEDSSPMPSKGERSRSKKKGSSGGLFSSISGLTKIDDEDGFHMMDNASESTAPSNGTVWGKNNIDIEANRVSSDDADSSSRGINHAGQEGITVQKDWSVSVDDRKRNT